MAGSDVALRSKGEPAALATRTAVAVIDLDLSAKNSEQLQTHGLPPTWRALWQQLASRDVDLCFLSLSLDAQRVDEVINALRQGGVGILVVHIDNFLPGVVRRLFQRLKEGVPNLTALACGYLPTVRAAELLALAPALDGVFRGPLEAVLPSLGRALTGEKEWARVPNFFSRTATSQSPYRAPVIQVEELGEGCRSAPVRELMRSSLQGGVGIIQASSGCPGRCAFCRTSAFYRGYSRKPYTLRAVDDLVAEIAYLHHNCGIEHFKFYDNNYLGTPKLAPRRARALAAGLSALGLKITFELHCRTDTVTAEVLDHLCPAGLRHLALGIESMAPSQLARYEKGETVTDHRRAAALVAERGLLAQGYSILADPLVTREELAETLAGLAALNGQVLILIHERMILYETTPYFERHRSHIRGARAVPSSLNTVVQYDFADPWVRRFFPLAEESSQGFKKVLAAYQRRSLPKLTATQLHQFVTAGTGLRLELLQRIVDADAPTPERVQGFLAAAQDHIPSLAQRFEPRPKEICQ